MRKTVKILLGVAGSGKTEFIKQSLLKTSESNFSVYDGLKNYNFLRKTKNTRERIVVHECSSFMVERNTEDLIKSLTNDIFENKTIIIDETYWIFSGDRFNILKEIMDAESLKILLVFQSIDQIKQSAPFLLEKDFEILYYNSSVQRIESNWVMDDFFNK